LNEPLLNVSGHIRRYVPARVHREVAQLQLMRFDGSLRIGERRFANPHGRQSRERLTIERRVHRALHVSSV